MEVQQCTWNNLEDFFEDLNKEQEYIVLRNYENFTCGLLEEAHPDIDILCRSRKSFLKSISTKTRTNEKDMIHRYVIIENKKVDIDLREVGDGYYDRIWQEDMLNKKVLFNEEFYVMDSYNYFYSLLYHILVQKNNISHDYKVRIKKMGDDLGIRFSEDKAIGILEEFMEKNNYKYTYPEFAGGIFNIQNAKKSLIEINAKKRIERYIYRLKYAIRTKVQKRS